MANDYNPMEDELEDDNKGAQMPWYMVHEEGKFMVFWRTIFSLLVVVNFIYAPLIQAFKHLRQSNAIFVESFEATIEVLWGL